MIEISLARYATITKIYIYFLWWFEFLKYIKYKHAQVYSTYMHFLCYYCATLPKNTRYPEMKTRNLTSIMRSYSFQLTFW